MSATSTRQLPSAIRAARILLFINAAIWLMLGVATLLRMSQTTPESSLTQWIIAILMAGNVGMMLLCGWGLGTGRRWFYFLAVVVLAVNIILTFTRPVSAGLISSRWSSTGAFWLCRSSVGANSHEFFRHVT